MNSLQPLNLPRRKATRRHEVFSCLPAALFITVCFSAGILSLDTAASGDEAASARVLAVDAGPDLVARVGERASLAGSVKGSAGAVQFAFWRVLEGPGAVEFAHAGFNDSFESGDVSLWLAGDAGNHTGKGKVSDSRPRLGRFSWHAHNPPGQGIDAKLLRWRFDHGQAMYSAWFYWPEDYVVNGREGSYVNIFQWKERVKPWDPTWVIAVKESPANDTDDDLVVHDYRGKRIIRNGVRLPKGRWFHVAAWLKTGRSDGRLVVWLDGRRVFDLGNIDTLGNETNPRYLMWGVGNYGGAAAGRGIWVDDVCVAPDAAGPPIETGAMFSMPGRYTIELVADDGRNTASGRVTVIVRQSE